MRSSNLKYCKKKKMRFSGSFLIAVIVIVSIIAIPCCTTVLNTKAVTEKDFRTLSVAVNEMKLQKEKKDTKKEIYKKIATEVIIPTSEELKKKNKPEEKKISTKIVYTESSENVSDYNPEYVALSDYDRAKVERLVEGEAGGLGYDGCLLVAQAIRDSMNLSDTSSIDKIINDYSYSGSTRMQPSKAAKKAVAYIFDDNGYAVNHRVLYFYATDMVHSEWHETQKYITTCGNMRFFDKSV